LRATKGPPNGVQKGRVRVSIFGAAFIAACCVGLLGILAGGPVEGTRAASDDGDWTYVEHDIGGTRFSPLTQITSKNVGKLAKVCSYTFPEKVPSESAPIVSAGVIYLTSMHYTVALDGADCRELWRYQWTPRERESVHANRGAAIAEGRIIRGTADDYLTALDSETGKLLWAKQIARSNDGFFISMPPLVHGDLIYIGPAGSESAASGWVGAFRLSDGEQVWRFNIVPADGEPGADTWGPDPAARKHAGGALWTPLSYDTEKDFLYVSGGNPAPDFYDDARPGINLYTNSIIALDAKTGKLAWYQQFIPHDVHDYDTTHVSPIFKSKSRTAIATSGKDGVLRVVDRDAHQVLYAVPTTTRINAEAPASPTPVHVCPGTLGGTEWNGAAFSPKLDLLVIPSNDNWCSEIQKDSEPPSAEKANIGEGPYFGGPLLHPPYQEATGWITGFDAASGKLRWRYKSPTPVVAGVTLTASNLVFTGETGGYFDALDAQSGRILARVNLKDSIQGGVVTYSAKNIQFVAVVSGDGGVISKKTFPQVVGGNPTVTLFAIPEVK
jgi:alcohol dehydrogenase (cytochrome c)